MLQIGLHQVLRSGSLYESHREMSGVCVCVCVLKPLSGRFILARVRCSAFSLRINKFSYLLKV